MFTQTGLGQEPICHLDFCSEVQQEEWNDLHRILPFWWILSPFLLLLVRLTDDDVICVTRKDYPLLVELETSLLPAILSRTEVRKRPNWDKMTRPLSLSTNTQKQLCINTADEKGNILHRIGNPSIKPNNGFVNYLPFSSIMQSHHTSLSLHGHTPLLQPFPVYHTHIHVYTRAHAHKHAHNASVHLSNGESRGPAWRMWGEF